MAKKNPLISLYVRKFGRITTNGSWYMIQILQSYTEQSIPLDADGIKHLILAVSKEKGLKPSSIRSAIKRYLDNGIGIQSYGKDTPRGNIGFRLMLIQLLDCYVPPMLTLKKVLRMSINEPEKQSINRFQKCKKTERIFRLSQTTVLLRKR